jgi:hypothetical protein
VSRERLGNVLSKSEEERQVSGGTSAMRGVVRQGDTTAEAPQDPDSEAEAFVRFCYRRRSVAWPELYDEMCAVAAREEYRGMGYEQLGRMGIGFCLSALPHLAELAERVIAQERSPGSVAALA